MFIVVSGNVKESEELDEKTDKEKDLEISDEEWVSHECQLLSKPILNNSLGLLASAYDSDEEFIETESQKENKAEVISDGDEPPDEIKTIISKVSPLENCTERNKTPRKRKHNKKYLENKRQRNDSSQDKCQSRNLTLLEKLLRKEIIHERNVILQCVHYIVKNNFFANT